MPWSSERKRQYYAENADRIRARVKQYREERSGDLSLRRKEASESISDAYVIKRLRAGSPGLRITPEMIAVKRLELVAHRVRRDSREARSAEHAAERAAKQEARLQLRAVCAKCGCNPKAGASTYCGPCATDIARTWQLANPATAARSRRRSRARACEGLADSYIVRVLGMRSSDVTPQLLELKREQLCLRRLARELWQAGTKAKEEEEREAITNSH